MVDQIAPLPWFVPKTNDRKVCDKHGRKVATCTLHAGGAQLREHHEAAQIASFITLATSYHDALVKMVARLSLHLDTNVSWDDKAAKQILDDAAQLLNRINEGSL